MTFSLAGAHSRKTFPEKGKTLAFTESRISFSIALEAIPSEHQFSAATPAAQALTLLATINLEFQDLHYAISLLSACSRNLRRQLFANRAILSNQVYPALRLSGAKKEAEQLIWEWLKEARPDQPATKEKATKILSIVAKSKAAPFEVPLEASARNAKADLREKKAQAKALHRSLLDAALEGTITLETELHALLKEILKGDNLALCSNEIRKQIVEGLKALDNSCAALLAAIIADSYDPFIESQALCELESAFDKPAKKEKLSASELIRRNKQRRSGIERRQTKEEAEKVFAENLSLGLPEDL